MNAKVLFTAIMALFLAGCAWPAPLTTPTPTHCLMCAELAAISGLELASRYIARSYPEQGIARQDLQHLDKRDDLTRNVRIWSGGDWIIEQQNGTWPVSAVTVTNTATGFRWEGQVVNYREPPVGRCCNGLTYQKIVETSVALPAPGVPTPTPMPRSTATATGLVPPMALATRTPWPTPGE